MTSTKIDIIDIGAVGGFDAPWSRHQDKIGRSLSFEPNEPPILSGEHLRYNSAIWNIDGEATFYVSGPQGVGSSLLKQNVPWVRENFERLKLQGKAAWNASWFERSTIQREFSCKVKKLDSVLAELRRSLGEDLSFQFLKSDTQSGEFFVLEGAERFLEGDCLGMELELFRYPLYEGLVTEERVIEYLGAKGFEIAGWTGYMNSFLASADYLFLRKEPRTDVEAQKLTMLREVYSPRGKDRLIKQRTLADRIRVRSKWLLNLLLGRR